MTAHYHKHGIRFQYPANWILDESEADEHSVSVYSPDGAFWSLTWRPADVRPQDLAVEALNALKKEYAETESEPASETLAGQELSGFDVSFYYVDLTNTALIRGFRTADATFLILCQAEDHDFREVEAVFQAITTSLVAGQTQV